MDEDVPRRFRVSFAGPTGAPALSVITPLNNADRDDGGVGHSPFDSLSAHSRRRESSIVLIDRKQINDFQRFRMLYVGLILMVNASTQGVFALYGLYMHKFYRLDVRTMVDIYTIGTCVGLFAFPFGVLGDYFGPKVVIVIGTILTALSHLLFGLTFGDHIEWSKNRFCFYFAMMNFGCYAFDVAVLPAIVTHMPRDRALPIGIVKTFSGLGPSVLSCLFRGFFNDHYDNLMYFIAALVLFVGCIGFWYFDNAPYEVMRFREGRLKLKDRLALHLTRNRYMSQLLPTKRLHILGLILTLLNFYLTIQAVFAAYYRDDMTKKDYRGLAFGALMIVFLFVVLLIPHKILDGPTPQDHEVINTAQQKEKELTERRKNRKGGNRHEINNNNNNNNNFNPLPLPNEAPHSPFGDYVPENVNNSKKNKNEQNNGAADTPRTASMSLTISIPTPQEIINRQSGSKETDQSRENNNNNNNNNNKEDDDEDEINIIEVEGEGPVDPDAQLLPVSNNWMSNLVSEEVEMERSVSNPFFKTSCVRDHSHHHHNNNNNNNNQNDMDNDENNATQNSNDIEFVTREHSTYNCPYVETITVCGEVFVTPVYETTFLQSLTYIDIWMLFYTTLVVWGIGITLTANLNIGVMVFTRYTTLQYKTYVLIAAMTGVSLAGGRVVLGIYAQLLPRINKHFGLTLPSTVALPFPSFCLTVAMILYLSLPGNLSLIAVYVIVAFGFGFSTSITFLVISVIFKRDIGMHYGFCFTGASIGVALMFRALFFTEYDKYKTPYLPGPIPNIMGFCFGNKCLQTTLIIYLILSISSFGSSLIVHLRYWQLVHGKLKYRRVSSRLREHWRRRLDEKK